MANGQAGGGWKGKGKGKAVIRDGNGIGIAFGDPAADDESELYG
jgi:hypothetical protein